MRGAGFRPLAPRTADLGDRGVALDPETRGRMGEPGPWTATPNQQTFGCGGYRRSTTGRYPQLLSAIFQI